MIEDKRYLLLTKIKKENDESKLKRNWISIMKKMIQKPLLMKISQLILMMLTLNLMKLLTVSLIITSLIPSLKRKRKKSTNFNESKELKESMSQLLNLTGSSTQNKVKISSGTFQKQQISIFSPFLLFKT